MTAHDLTPWRQFLASLPHRRTIRERDSSRASYAAAAEWRQRNGGRFADDWRWSASLRFLDDMQLADQMIEIDLNRSEYLLHEERPLRPARRAARKAA